MNKEFIFPLVPFSPSLSPSGLRHLLQVGEPARAQWLTISPSPHLPISPSPHLPISPSPHPPISPSPCLLSQVVFMTTKK